MKLFKSRQPLGMPKELLKMLVSPSISVSSGTFGRSSEHGSHLGIPEVRGLPRVIGNAHTNRPRFLRAQKGPDLVKDFLSDRSDTVGVNDSNGLA